MTPESGTKWVSKNGMGWTARTVSTHRCNDRLWVIFEEETPDTSVRVESKTLAFFMSLYEPVQDFFVVGREYVDVLADITYTIKELYRFDNARLALNERQALAGVVDGDGYERMTILNIGNFENLKEVK